MKEEVDSKSQKRQKIKWKIVPLKHGAHRQAIVYTSITKFPPETNFENNNLVLYQIKREKAEGRKAKGPNACGRESSWFEKINQHHTSCHAP